MLCFLVGGAAAWSAGGRIQTTQFRVSIAPRLSEAANEDAPADDQTALFASLRARFSRGRDAVGLENRRLTLWGRSDYHPTQRLRRRLAFPAPF